MDPLGVGRGWYTLVQVAYDLVMKLNPRKVAAHGVITDEQGRVLVLRSRYAGVWSLPGGGVNRGENLDAALVRECREELGVEVAVEALTGVYYHGNISAYVSIFRCRVAEGSPGLSHEHSALRWAEPSALPGRLRIMAEDGLNYAGRAMLRSF